MEIAFFSAPEANTAASSTTGEQGLSECPVKEFSFLLAAMLKSSDLGAFSTEGFSGDEPEAAGAEPEGDGDAAGAASLAALVSTAQQLPVEPARGAQTGGFAAPTGAPAAAGDGDDVTGAPACGPEETAGELAEQASAEAAHRGAAFGPELSGAEASLEVPDELTEYLTDEAASSSVDEGAGADGLADAQAAGFQGLEAQGEELAGDNEGQPALAEAEGVRPEAAAAPSAFGKLIERADAAGPAAARPSTVAAEVHEKVQAGIRVSAESGGGEVKMKLHPESLGEVRVRLNVSEGVVRAEIMVDSAEVKGIIEADAAFLKESLGAHGLTLEKCVVEVGRSFDAREREYADGRHQQGHERKTPEEGMHEKGKGWQRQFGRNQGRDEDGGVDFFV